MTAHVMLPSVCVRVLASPEVCQARVQKRMETEKGRKCEEAISLQYLQGLEREIDHMVGVLRAMGVIIFDLPWDASRPDHESRQQTVKALAERIEALEPPDFFLDKHRRTL